MDDLFLNAFPFMSIITIWFTCESEIVSRWLYITVMSGERRDFSKQVMIS